MKRIVAIMLVTLIVFFILSGCKKVENEGNVENILDMIDDKSKNSLTIYCDYMTRYIKSYDKLIIDFRLTHPDVELIVYDPTNGGTISDSDAWLKFSTDMMAGKGPDIILSDGYRFNYKSITSGIFMDLNEFINEDSSFDIELYDNVIMESGVFQGKRVALPFLYTTCSLMTTRERMSELGIPLDTLKTPEGILTAFEIADKSRQLTSNSMYWMTSYSWFEDIIDYENNTVDTNNEYLHRVIDLKKDMRDRSNFRDGGSNTKEYFDEIYKTEAFYESLVVYLTAAYYEAHDAKCEIVSVPNNHNGTTAVVYLFSLVNQNCKNKELAWEFLKCTLRESFQGSSYFLNIGLPVLKSIQDDRYSYECRHNSDGDVDFKDKMVSYILGTRKPITNVLYEYEINDILELLDRFEPYINDESSYDECLAGVENYYSIYMTE